MWITTPQTRVKKGSKTKKFVDKKQGERKKWINLQKRRKKSEKMCAIIHKRLFFSTRRKKFSTNMHCSIFAYGVKLCKKQVLEWSLSDAFKTHFYVGDCACENGVLIATQSTVFIFD